MQTWLKLWNFIDKQESFGSLQAISAESGISYPSVLDAVRMLEDVNYINVVMDKNRKTVVKTDRWFETRDNIKDLYVFLDESEKK